MFRNTLTTVVLLAGLAGCFVLVGTLLGGTPSIPSNEVGVSS